MILVTGATGNVGYPLLENLDDAGVPATAMVGQENGGWPLVTNQLNHERVALTSSAPLALAVRQTVEWAGKTKTGDSSRLIDKEWVQLNLARVHAKVEYLKLLNWEIAARADSGGSRVGSNTGGSRAGSNMGGDAAPRPWHASTCKVYGTELATEAYRLLMEVLGPQAYLRQDSPGAELRGRLERMHRACLILTFGGGTNEVQRDIIAMTALQQPAAVRRNSES